MKFGIDVCKMLSIKKEKNDHNQDILLKRESYLCPWRKTTKTTNYKYLGISRSNNSLHGKVKKKSSLEYLKQGQKKIKIKWWKYNESHKDIVDTVNWTQVEMDNLDQKT